MTTDPDAIDAIAGQFMLIRRGNPDMGGPDPRDYRNAARVLDALKAYGYAIVPLRSATVLRHVDHVLEGAGSALVAFGDDRYAKRLSREYERLRSARSELAGVLERLPPEPPMSPERAAELLTAEAERLGLDYFGGNDG